MRGLFQRMNLTQWLYSGVLLLATLHLASSVEDDKKSDKKSKKLQIGVKKRVEPENCPIKSRKGDTLHMHYTVCRLYRCL